MLELITKHDTSILVITFVVAFISLIWFYEDKTVRQDLKIEEMEQEITGLSLANQGQITKVQAYSLCAAAKLLGTTENMALAMTVLAQHTEQTFSLDVEPGAARCRCQELLSDETALNEHRIDTLQLARHSRTSGFIPPAA